MSIPPAFIKPLLSSYASEPLPHKPHVTLTFAQSIDAKIGKPFDGQFILSGRQSMLMTHWLRTMHDGILVGIGTVLSDNPQLNIRLLPLSSPPLRSPRPIILDTNLRLPTTCKLIQNFQAGTGRRPWVICSSFDSEKNERKQALEATGVRIFEIKSSHDKGYVPIPSLLHTLRANGIKTLMVEGGARVIESFLSEYSPQVVDRVVITVAPVLIGNTGVGYQFPSLYSNGDFEKTFQVVHTETFETDTVIALTSTQ